MVKRNIRRALIKLIRFYQTFISPFFPSNCRFYPTCSQYAIEAIETHGCVTGLGKTLHRLSRCHPFSKQHGYDPVNKTKGNN